MFWLNEFDLQATEIKFFTVYLNSTI